MFSLRLLNRVLKYKERGVLLKDFKPSVRCSTFEASNEENQLSDLNNAPMEKSINQITLLGRVGNEPQKKGTDSHPVIIFSLATHTQYKYETGEMVQKTDWHRISVFKPSLRDLVLSYLHKGQRVFVTGRMTYGSTKEDGYIRTTSSVIAEEIIFFQSGGN